MTCMWVCMKIAWSFKDDGNHFIFTVRGQQVLTVNLSSLKYRPEFVISKLLFPLFISVYSAFEAMR